MLNKIMSFLGYEKKSNNNVNINITNLRQLYDVGLSPNTAFWLWAKSDSIGDAVDRIAEQVSQINPVLKDKKTKEIIKEHKALDLLENVKFGTNSNLLKRELITSLLLT